MHNLINYLLILLLSSTYLSAKVYEDAEDKTITKWSMPTGTSIRNNILPTGKVTNVYDSQLKSRVIQLKGDGYNTVYITGMDKRRYFRSKSYAKGRGWDTQNTILTFKIKSTEGFLIDVWVKTNKGRRLIRYSDTAQDAGLEDADAEESFKFFGLKNKVINIALGYEAGEGSWQSYTVDLIKDLHKFEPALDISKVEGLEIRGNCSFDDIEMKKSTSAHIGILEGKVWNDTNQDWEFDKNESPLANISVDLYNQAYDKNTYSWYPVKIKTTKTNKKGEYKFTNLPISYFHAVQVVVPKNMQLITPKKIEARLGVSGDPMKKSNLNFGIYKEKLYSIKGLTWRDKNENWEYEKKEIPYPSIALTLYDVHNKEIKTLKSNKKGKYNFKNLKMGQYTLKLLKSKNKPNVKFVTETIYEFWLEKNKKNLNFGVTNKPLQ